MNSRADFLNKQLIMRNNMKNIVLSFSLLLSIFLVSCVSNDILEPSGNFEKKSRTIVEFTKLEISDAIEVEMTKADSCSLQLETYTNYHPYIYTDVSGSTLRIYTSSSVDLNGSKIKVYLTCKELSQIKASGATKTLFLNKISAEQLNVFLSGASELKGEVNLKNLKLDISGASYINLAGITTDLNIESSGASRVYLYPLVAENAILNISGASVAEVNSTKTLSVSASDASKVYYKGNPTIAKSNLTGASTLQKAD